MASSDSGNKSPILLIILLLLSIGLNGYFFYSLKKKTAENNDLSAQVSDLSARVDSLSATSTNLKVELTTTSNELEEFRGLSTSLDSLLDIANADIKAKEKRISQLKKDVSKKKELETEIAELRTLKESYLNQIDSLVMANGLLQVQVVEFQKSVETLAASNQELSSTVERGSILSAGNINSTSFKQKGSGKYATTVVAAKTKRIEVCFDLSENKISKAGDKQVYVKIVGPDGVTLGGAGSFTAKGDSTESRFSTSGMLTYENKQKNYCINYDQEVAFAKGNYQVEVYTEGYFSGVGAFILK